MNLRKHLGGTWQSSLICLTLSILWLLLWYWDTAATMVGVWARSGTFTHAFLVPPISLWLILRLRQPLAAITPRPAWWLAMPVALLAFLWLLGELAAVNVVTQFALVALIVAAVPMLLGMQLARAITFPLLFLFFCVPFGEFVMPTLMHWTANITVLGVRMSGVPVYQEGLQFVIPSGKWSVVEACSGVRYLIASICVGVLFAYLNYRSLKRRLLFVAAAVAVPLVANWVRAYGIVMLGHVSGNTLATGVDHLVYGWVFFGLVITVLFMIGMRWQEAEVMPVFAVDKRPPPQAKNLAIAAVVFAVLVCLPKAALWMIEHNTARATPDLSVSQLGAIAGWQRTDLPLTTWQPAFSGQVAELHASYQQGEQKVGVYIGFYRQQDYTRKLISSENVLVRSGDAVWAQLKRGAQALALGGRPLDLKTAVLRSGELAGGHAQRLQVWQWYWLNGHETGSDLKGKLYTTLGKLMGRGDDAAVIILYAPEEQVGGADAALAAFAEAGHASLIELLQRAGRQR